MYRAARRNNRFLVALFFSLCAARSSFADVVLPRVGVDLDILQATLRALASLVLSRRWPREGCARKVAAALLVVSEVVDDVAEGEEERAGVGPVRQRLELELEELLHHVQLAQVPVHAPRGTSRFSIRPGFSLYASWKCFSALTPARNFVSRTRPRRRWNPPLSRRRRCRRRFPSPTLRPGALPVPNVLEYERRPSS